VKKTPKLIWASLEERKGTKAETDREKAGAAQVGPQRVRQEWGRTLVVVL